MKICEFCGCKVEEEKIASCPNCGSTAFQHVCPNCQNVFEGSFCNDCGIRYDAIPKTCPNCGKVYFTKACPECGHDGTRAGAQRTVDAFNNNANANTTPGQGTATATRAVLALVFSAMGMFTCMFPFSILGLVMAVKEEGSGNKSKITTSAKVVAITGMIMGFLWIIAMANSGGSN